MITNISSGHHVSFIHVEFKKQWHENSFTIYALTCNANSRGSRVGLMVSRQGQELHWLYDNATCIYDIKLCRRIIFTIKTPLT